MKLMVLFSRLMVCVTGLPGVLALPGRLEADPTVTALNPRATIIGSRLLGGVEMFNGIPYAQPPVGYLRFKPPQPLQWPAGKVIKATGIPRACPQFLVSTDTSNAVSSAVGTLLKSPVFQAATFAGEDCLTLNVQRPKGTKSSDKLPVLYWIFGGGFSLGSTQLYNTQALVEDSIGMKMPMIVVAVNYRIGAFGFMPGAEILRDGSANAGILDQRLGLQWVADNIAAFGGDPNKVTVWGESSGAISVFQQMAIYDGNHTYNGKPLFRGAIMNSGSITPTDDIDSAKGQAVYDTVVRKARCDSATDTLQCLRDLDYTQLLNAANTMPSFFSYTSIALSYLPRPDGVVLTDSPDRLAKQGKYAPVPLIVGDQEDEGTAFSLFQWNITTTDELRDYLARVFFHNATTAQLSQIIDTYPDKAAAGSPFRTSLLNNWYPQYKRLAAILGDMVFTLTRRMFLENAAVAHPNVPSWSYLATYGWGTPILGTFHGSDILEVVLGSSLLSRPAKSIRGYYFSFVYYLDPNNGTLTQSYWPTWAPEKQMMEFGHLGRNRLISDTFRQKSYDCINQNVDALHL